MFKKIGGDMLSPVDDHKRKEEEATPAHKTRSIKLINPAILGKEHTLE